MQLKIKQAESRVKVGLMGLFLLFFIQIGMANTEMKDQKETRVIIETPYGKMKLKLYNETPQHRDNFIKLVKLKVYDSLLFHRVIQNFMIQGGDPNSKHAIPGQMLGTGDLGYSVPAEIKEGLFHKKGALAAARVGDDVNPQRASSSCQFYIVQGQVYSQAQLPMLEGRMGSKLTPEQEEAYTSMGGTPHLDGQYTVFGQLEEGWDVLDKIASQEVNSQDRPIEDIRINIMIEEGE